MKKVSIVLGIVVAIAIAFLVRKNESIAKNAEFAVTVENQKVKKGDEITLLVKVKSSLKLSKIEAYLEYDKDILEFISASKSAVNGTSGTLSIAETFEKSVLETEYEITMRALEVGTSQILIHDVYLEDDKNSDIVEINQTTANIDVIMNKNENSDATLSELLVFPGALNQEFASDIDEYEVEVDANTKELILSAVPAVSESVVEIDQPEVLEYGANDITITVTAPSGNTKEYHITVNRSKK